MYTVECSRGQYFKEERVISFGNACRQVKLEKFLPTIGSQQNISEIIGGEIREDLSGYGGQEQIDIHRSKKGEELEAGYINSWKTCCKEEKDNNVIAIEECGARKLYS